MDDAVVFTPVCASLQYPAEQIAESLIASFGSRARWRRRWRVRRCEMPRSGTSSWTSEASSVREPDPVERTGDGHADGEDAVTNAL